MHRDLKPENCLITEYLVCKLSDFGESRAVDFDGDMTIVGSPYFMAPEVFRGEAYDESCDLFSLALLIASMGVVNGKVTYVLSKEAREGKKLTQMQKQRLSGMGVANRHARGWRADLSWFARPDGGCWPPEMRRLIERCWEKDRRKRPTINSIAKEIDGWTGSMFVKEWTVFQGKDDGV